MGARTSALEGYGDDFAWSLFDAAPDGILVTAVDGEIVFANDASAAVFGTTTKDLLGRSVDELVPSDVRKAHRAHRNRYRAAPTVRAMGVGLHLRALRVDGTQFHAEISLSPLRLGDELFTVAAVRDITDRVVVQDRLQRVMHTLDASDDGIFIFDADTLRYSYVNEGAVRLVGYGATELTGMTPVHLNPHASEQDYRDLIARLLADPEITVRREARLLRRDGEEVPVEKTFQSGPVDRDGSRWIISLVRDVSDRLASEEALHEAEQRMLLAEERDRIARDLHDTVIQRLFGTGLSLQAASTMADEAVRDRLEAAIADVDEMILDLRTTIFSLQGARTPRSGLRGRLLDVAGDAGRSLGCDPRVQFDGPIDALPETLGDELVPVLREALSNVAKHARATRVRVSVAVDDEVVLTVTDDGIGTGGDVYGGSGLANLADRAKRLGGSMRLTEPDGGGCSLEWRVPTPPN